MAFMPTWQYLLPNPTRKRVGLLTLLPTIDSVSDVSRVTRGLAIRRAKKRVNLTKDKRIKMCSQRFDSHAYTWLEFLRAVSHAVGSANMLSERHSDADDDDDTEAPDDNTQHQNDDDTSDDSGTPTTVSADAAVDFCEMCPVAPRDYTHRAGAVRSSTLLWVVCQRSAQPRTRLSSLPHDYQRVAASVLTWLTRELVFENKIARSSNKK